MRTVINLLLLGGLTTTCLSCSFEFRPPSALNGAYELEPGCLLRVDEVTAAASCDKSGTKVQVTIEDDLLTFDPVTVRETVTHTDCWFERICTKTYTGAMRRKSRKGTPYDGRFSALGGEWEGKLIMKTKCQKEVPKQNPPPWCAGTGTSDVVYTVTAEVDAHEAKISWSADDGPAGDFSAQETQGGVRVADTFYPRVEAQEPHGE